jgi:hypothetical protein
MSIKRFRDFEKLFKENFNHFMKKDEGKGGLRKDEYV